MPNFHNAWSAARFRASEMNVPLAALDLALTYNRPAIVHCDGDLTWNSSTGALAWSGTLRVLFSRTDGFAIQNTVAAGSITLTAGQMAYVVLSETNDAVVTVVAAAVTAGAASPTLAYNRLVLAYRNTASNECFLVALRQRLLPLQGTIATKTFWQGTQAAYDALGTWDSNTIYFIGGA